MNKNRNIALDLIRTIAILFVITVHSFKFTGYYAVIFQSKSLYVYTAIRWITYTCVPLFLLLTGYLQNKKDINKNYYKSIFKVIYSYVFISICAIIFKNIYLNEEISIINAIVSIFNFTADDYAWYVEMYIGLFLIIPFLNIMYDALKTRKNKKILILTFLILTSLTLLFKSAGNQLNITSKVPEYWECLYPITYYFIGAYICEFNIKINKKIFSIIFIIYTIAIAIITFWVNYGKIYDWAFLGSYSCITTVILAVMIFLLLYDINIKNNVVRKTLTSISIHSFDMYLFSYIFDNFCYNEFKNVLNGEMKIYYMIFLVPIIFLLSYIASICKQYVFNIINKTIVIITNKLKGFKNEENINNYSNL